MKGYRWQLAPKAPDGFLSGRNLPRLLVQLLYNRGISSENEIEPFVSADSRLSHDPFLLPDIEPAIVRILRALFSGEIIAVYGDYDVDGIAGTAILVKGLKTLGGRVIPYIPHRILEGYGLNTSAIQELKNQSVSLIITVDNGITAVDEVREAKKLGVDVIITDHHIPLLEIPEAAAVVNPKRPDSKYPFLELSGAGVAFKLIEALYRNIGRAPPVVADLVALGTIADITPLVGENRYLVKEGLAHLNSEPGLGISEMKTLTGLGNVPLDAENIAWVIAPRINAAGRLAHAMEAYKLLMTESADEARELARLLEGKNAERQELTARVITEAREQILLNGENKLLFVSDPGYPAGITGIAASKLTEEFYRPVVLVSTGETVSSGSCRSIPEFNIMMALASCRHLLSRFGGHSQAAGFSIANENIKEFAEKLCQMAEVELTGKELAPCLEIDAEATLTELGGATFKMIQRLAPFGRGNLNPTFLAQGARVLNYRIMGNRGEHLRLTLRQDAAVWDAVAFRQRNNFGRFPPYIDIVFSLEADTWRGREQLRLNIQDFRPMETDR